MSDVTQVPRTITLGDPDAEKPIRLRRSELSFIHIELLLDSAIAVMHAAPQLVDEFSAWAATYPFTHKENLTASEYDEASERGQELAQRLLASNGLTVEDLRKAGTIQIPKPLAPMDAAAYIIPRAYQVAKPDLMRAIAIAFSNPEALAGALDKGKLEEEYNKVLLPLRVHGAPEDVLTAALSVYASLQEIFAKERDQGNFQRLLEPLKEQLGSLGNKFTEVVQAAPATSPTETTSSDSSSD